MAVFGFANLWNVFGDLNKNGRYLVFQAPNGDDKIQFLIENTTVTVPKIYKNLMAVLR